MIDTSLPAILGMTDTLSMNPIPTPHNIVLSPDNGRLYVTHSGAMADQVSFYDISDPNGIPVSLGAVTVGLNPFGIAAVPALVPAPGTIALLLVGGLPLAAVRRLRGRK